jgi:uncharacterized protein (DUF3084 family)
LFHRKQELETDCQAMQMRTMELTETHNILQQNFDILTDKVNDLYNEKYQVEQFVSRFKYTNRKYHKIKSIVEQIVNRQLAERGPLLTSAVITVVQALRTRDIKTEILE